jgi:hypothetical protein
MSRARWLLRATSHSAVGASTADGDRNKTQLMHTLSDLRARGRISWIEAHHGCGAPRRTISWMRSPGMVSNSVSGSREPRARDLTLIAIDEPLQDHVFNGLEDDP